MEDGLGSVSLVEASVPSCWELLLGGYVQFGSYVFTTLLPAQQYFCSPKSKLQCHGTSFCSGTLTDTT